MNPRSVPVLLVALTLAACAAAPARKAEPKPPVSAPNASATPSIVKKVAGMLALPEAAAPPPVPAPP